MSYIEKARQNKENAEKARALDDLVRRDQTQSAVQEALKTKEQERINTLVSEFAPTQRDYEMQIRADKVAESLGRPLSTNDYATAARNWTPTRGVPVQESVNKHLNNVFRRRGMV